MDKDLTHGLYQIHITFVNGILSLESAPILFHSKKELSAVYFDLQTGALQAIL